MDDLAVITINEVALILKASPQHVIKLLRAGDLPGVKIGRRWRVSKETLAAWLAAGGV